MCLESKVRKMEEIRYTEIDGKRFDVRKCDECPFRDMGDAGYAAHCTYPTLERNSENTLWIEDDGVSIQEGCPLRTVTTKMTDHMSQHLAQCPFCYGRSVLVHCVCDNPTFKFDTYRVECSECGASTLEDSAKSVKLMWERGYIGKRVGKHR